MGAGTGAMPAGAGGALVAAAVAAAAAAAAAAATTDVPLLGLESFALLALSWGGTVHRSAEKKSSGREVRGKRGE